MKHVDWWFDPVSPFSYVAFELLPTTLGPEVQVAYRPLLFAALLDHWGQKGPAEIPTKRTFTYEHIVWLASRHGIALRAPRAHPFNPLPLLRAIVAAGATREAIDAVFRFVWRDGHLPDDSVAFDALLASLRVTRDALQAPEVKAALRANTDAAIAAGLFGVPTAVATRDASGEQRMFWGVDAMPMLVDWLGGASVFASDEMRRAATLPVGIVRR